MRPFNKYGPSEDDSTLPHTEMIQTINLNPRTVEQLAELKALCCEGLMRYEEAWELRRLILSENNR